MSRQVPTNEEPLPRRNAGPGSEAAPHDFSEQGDPDDLNRPAVALESGDRHGDSSGPARRERSDPLRAYRPTLVVIACLAIVAAVCAAIVLGRDSITTPLLLLVALVALACSVGTVTLGDLLNAVSDQLRQVRRSGDK